MTWEELADIIARMPGYLRKKPVLCRDLNTGDRFETTWSQAEQEWMCIMKRRHAMLLKEKQKQQIFRIVAPTRIADLPPDVAYGT